MLFSYPVALRGKAVKAYLNGKETQKEIANIFGIGLSTLGHYLKQYEQSSDLAAKPHPGRPTMLGEAELQRIKHWLKRLRISSSRNYAH